MIVRAASWGAAALAVHAAANSRRLRVPPASHPSAWAPLVSVLIPARNEEATIERCLQAVLASKGVVLEVVVLDDGSIDQTPALAMGVAQRDRRVRVLTGEALPAGWLGKPWACAQLAEVATAPVLVFLDADVVVEPDALVRTVALMDEAELDLVSPYPRQIAGSPAERLVQPLLQWSWLTFLPLRLAETLPVPSLVAANGQLLVCRRPAYDAAGGHSTVRGEVLEDVALARAFKAAGMRATVADGTDLATCRMYDGWAALRDGYSKSLWATTRTAAGAGAMSALLLWLFVLPPAAAVWRLATGRRGALAPLLGYTAGVAGRAVAAKRTGGRLGDAPAHPVSIATLVWLHWRSRRLHRTGRLTWKGRALR